MLSKANIYNHAVLHACLIREISRRPISDRKVVYRKRLKKCVIPPRNICYAKFSTRKSCPHCRLTFNTRDQQENSWLAQCKWKRFDVQSVGVQKNKKPKEAKLSRYQQLFMHSSSTGHGTASIIANIKQTFCCLAHVCEPNKP